MCGEEAGGLNSPPAGRGDEKADSWQPRSRSQAAALPSPHQAGAPVAACGAATAPLYLFRGRRKDTGDHSSLPTVPTPRSQPPCAPLPVNEGLPPRGGQPAGPDLLISCCQKGLSPHPQLPSALPPPTSRCWTWAVALGGVAQQAPPRKDTLPSLSAAPTASGPTCQG